MDGASVHRFRYDLGVDDETEALIETLRLSRRPTMRLETARRLAEKRDPDAASALIELLDSTNDPRIIPVVTVAITGLQALGDAIAGELLRILDEPYGPRRVFMPLLLASALGIGAAPRLVKALADDDTEVAVNAATQLGQLRAVEAFEALVALLEDQSRPSALRGAAAAAIGASRDPRALSILAHLSTSTDRDLLAGAIDGLSDLRDPRGAQFLEAILERDDIDESTNRAVRLGLLAMERYRPRA